MTTQKPTSTSIELQTKLEPGAARDRDGAILRLAPSRATVLLIGGSPEVKLLVARALHERSPRASRPFVSVDCAASRPEAIEELLFGEPWYGRLMPPGAQGEPRGAIGEAAHGTLYLAAIDSLPMSVQPRFLRFLDEPRTVRVVASCDADLAQLTRQGHFRADLGERISLVWIDLSDSDMV